MVQAEYMPYGPEWEKAMAKLKKAEIIKMVGRIQTGKGFTELQMCSLFMGWLQTNQERIGEVDTDLLRDCFCDAIAYVSVSGPPSHGG